MSGVRTIVEPESKWFQIKEVYTKAETGAAGFKEAGTGFVMHHGLLAWVRLCQWVILT